MHVNDTISEFLGALVNMVTEACKNSPQQLNKEDLNEILKRAKIENSQGEDYKNPHSLIEKALKYWEEKDCRTVVKNIKEVFPFYG